MSNNITVSGINELIKSLRDLGNEGIPIAKSASEKASIEYETYAKQEAEKVLKSGGKNYYGKNGNSGKEQWNHGKGNLKRSIKAKKPKHKTKGKSQVYATVGFGKGAAYGVPVEFGHKLVFFVKKTNKWVKPFPFLRPAFDKNKYKLLNTMIDSMWKLIESTWNKGV